jgi:polyhydroxybutyrate depolymerase
LEQFLQAAALTDTYGFIYAYPDGALDPSGDLYWNATDACCDLFDEDINHVKYLKDLIDKLDELYNLDPQRIYIMGHSNGGFMAYRMACERAGRIAAIASLAGAADNDPAQCNPGQPVHTLQVHGTMDGTISYAGGIIASNEYPGAVATTEQWAAHNGCDDEAENLPDLDLDNSILGDETTVIRYSQGCSEGGSSELWTINGGGHVPNFSPSFRTTILDWLFEREKPATVNIAINAGFNDAWRNPEKKGGQGVFVVVFPEIEYIFLAWFTYDLTLPAEDIDFTMGHPSQRWYTAFGPYTGDTAVLDLELNSNGAFDSAAPINQVTDGKVTLKAISCEEMLLSYEIASADVSGNIPLGRIVDDNVERCQSLASGDAEPARVIKPATQDSQAKEDAVLKMAEGVEINAGFNDAWRNPIKKGGQGVFAVVFPLIKSIFMAWFTYDTEEPADDIDYTIGHPSQRWYTAFGPYEGDTAVLDLELNSNGIFDSAEEIEQMTDGTVTLQAIDCEEMLLTYDIFSADVQGEIPLGRIVDDNVPFCLSFANEDQ